MRAGRRVGFAFAGLALVAAAGYVLIYLYRWEWHRALVAAVFMLALEVGIGFAVVLERLGRIEQRLSASERDSHDEVVGALRATRPADAEPFAWLTDASERMSVFVPILLGAGVVLSALAWAVERLARATARPTLERHLAFQLQPLTVPAGTLFGDAPGLPAAPARAAHRGRAAAIAILAALAVLGATRAVDHLADATQNRPDVLTADSTSAIVIRIDNRQAPAADAAATRSLWSACRNQIGTRYNLVSVEPATGGALELLVRPSIGKYAERRLRGCFEDAGLDLIRADIVSLSSSAG